MIAPWMLYAIVISALVACAALGVEQIARMKRWPARTPWLVAVVASVVIPVAADLFAHPAASQIGASGASAAPISRLSLNTLLVAVWCLGSLVVLARVMVGAWVLRHRRMSWRADTIDGAPVLLTDGTGPALVGLVRPRPVIPTWVLDLDVRDRALILRHEVEHARASDPWLRIIGVVCTVATPWNPVLWWSVRRLHLAIEMDCDARVLRSGADPRTYASLLLAVGERATHLRFASATALAEPASLLERRILAMTSTSPARRPRLLIAAFAGVTAVATVVACEAPVPDQALPTTPSSQVAVALHRKAGDTVVIVNLAQARHDSALAREHAVMSPETIRLITSDSVRRVRGHAAGQFVRGELIPTVSPTMIRLRGNDSMHRVQGHPVGEVPVKSPT